MEIDYCTICVLRAIISDLDYKSINTRGDFPTDSKMKEWIINSGLLNHMRNEEGRKYKLAPKSDLMFIQTGEKKLSTKDNIHISQTISKATEHLTGEAKHCKKLRTILLEICGNSIEWAGTQNKQWLLGTKYEDNHVIFTITDVGKGILKSLRRRWGTKLIDWAGGNDDIDILKGAFIKKYGSTSQKANRNKGLPAIKNGFDIGLLLNLKVVTNGVILHYDSEGQSRLLRTEFRGTMYRWTITKESLQYG